MVVATESVRMPVAVEFSGTYGRETLSGGFLLKAESLAQGEASVVLSPENSGGEDYGALGKDSLPRAPGVAKLRISKGSLQGSSSGARADLNGTFSGSVNFECFVLSESLGFPASEAFMPDPDLTTEFCRQFRNVVK